MPGRKVTTAPAMFRGGYYDKAGRVIRVQVALPEDMVGPFNELLALNRDTTPGDLAIYLLAAGMNRDLDHTANVIAVGRAIRMWRDWVGERISRFFAESAQMMNTVPDRTEERGHE